jgi:hypothetical protein
LIQDDSIQDDSIQDDSIQDYSIQSLNKEKHQPRRAATNSIEDSKTAKKRLNVDLVFEYMLSTFKRFLVFSVSLYKASGILIQQKRDER